MRVWLLIIVDFTKIGLVEHHPDPALTAKLYTIVLRNADFITWNFTTKTQKPRRNAFVFFVPLWFKKLLED